jgi:hypothetical protein
MPRARAVRGVRPKMLPWAESLVKLEGNRNVRRASTISMQRFSIIAAVVFSLLVGASPRDVQGATLASLTAGGTLETALLKFDQFTYTGFTGGPAASAINVLAATASADLQGLTIAGSFSATTFAQASIGYRVTGKSGSIMHSASLAGNPAATGSNFVSVLESFSGGLPTLEIFAQSGSTVASDMNTFAPRTGITVTTLIRLNGAIGSPSTISFLEEYYGVATAHGADFDEDGEVDGRDFLTWQRNLGLTGAVTQQGDANGDGNVNEEDLAIWQNTFGPQSPVQSVPEPSGAAGAWAGLIAMLNVRRRGRAG